MKLCIPYDQGAVITQLHEIAQIQGTDYNEQGTILTVSLPASEAEKFLKYQIEE